MSETKGNKKAAIVVPIIVIGLVAAGGFGVKYYLDKSKSVTYTNGVSLYEVGEYASAKDELEKIAGYKDVDAIIFNCEYNLNKVEYDKATELYEQGEFVSASEIFDSLGDFENSKDMVQLCNGAERNLYIQKLGQTVYKINCNKELAMSTVSIILRDWEQANKEGIDATVKLRETYNEWGETVALMQETNTEIEGLMADTVESELASDAYTKVRELYEMYCKIYDYAISPSGDLNSYSDNAKGYGKKFDIALDKLYVSESDIKKVVETEVENKKQSDIDNASRLLEE
jgi:hypothetical protein